MCPGGTVVAATSEPGRVVTNGMSQYSRNERNANAGIVVGIEPDRLSRRSTTVQPAGRHRLAAALGSARVRAGRRELRRAGPAGRRLPRRPASTALGECCPPTGRACVRPISTAPARLRHRRHPRGAARLRPPDPRLRDARRGADRGGDAHLIAGPHPPRRRACKASTPRGLYPAGEGAGYAGGILSAAVDGIKSPRHWY